MGVHVVGNLVHWVSAQQYKENSNPEPNAQTRVGHKEGLLVLGERAA